jgi:hypothetical protein
MAMTAEVISGITAVCDFIIRRTLIEALLVRQQKSFSFPPIPLISLPTYLPTYLPTLHMHVLMHVHMQVHGAGGGVVQDFSERN